MHISCPHPVSNPQYFARSWWFQQVTTTSRSKKLVYIAFKTYFHFPRIVFIRFVVVKSQSGSYNPTILFRPIFYPRSEQDHFDSVHLIGHTVEALEPVSAQVGRVRTWIDDLFCCIGDGIYISRCGDQICMERICEVAMNVGNDCSGETVI